MSTPRRQVTQGEIQTIGTPRQVRMCKVNFILQSIPKKSLFDRSSHILDHRKNQEGLNYPVINCTFCDKFKL